MIIGVSFRRLKANTNKPKPNTLADLTLVSGGAVKWLKANM